MATTVELKKKTAKIEVQNGVDKDGSPTYAKRTLISNCKTGATDEKIRLVSEAIALVLADPTRNSYKVEESLMYEA